MPGLPVAKPGESEVLAILMAIGLDLCPLGLPCGHHVVTGGSDAGGEEHREPVLGEHDLRDLGERRAAVRGL